ncbi:hypothetical protein N7E02_03900 (plasmid) [Aliirhizobium terrae]|uniref:hypothetical protein n=1 Tax=Terrirhizobium terrae TaxID=2926709 RepID=UPI0025767110|nr:hypothetical protein [Rhizobium sp. CC-CFT758]WJH38560.1 hypothetical protein N7E02_03900 [Rhizobium sp. CC-CFT758]
MEMRAQRAALTKSARPEQALVQSELKASFSELAGALVRRIFGNCPPEVIAFFEARRLEAANTEIDSTTSGHEHTEAGNPKDG